MMRARWNAGALGSLFLMSLAMTACSGRPGAGGCWDACACGVALCYGPPESRLHLTGGGVASDGKRGVALLASSNDTGAEASPPAFLVWDGAQMAARPEPVQPDASMKRGPGESYVWTNPDLTITLAPAAGPDSGTLAVADHGKTTILHCKVVEKLVRCVP